MTDEVTKAIEAIAEYKKPNSLVDEGNLLWAAEVLKEACEDRDKRITQLETDLENINRALNGG